MQPKPKRTVFFVSDRTGLTAESYGKSLLAQFPGFAFDSLLHPFVDDVDRAVAVAAAIDAAAAGNAHQPVVFSTLVDEKLQAIIGATDACVINLFGTFLDPLEKCLGVKSAHTQGKSHDILGSQSYMRRLDAIDYALTHDDGVRPDQYDEAQIILVGVSRSGKTPTSLYLALNHSLYAGNYPLTAEELDAERLPRVLLKWKDKLVGLTISAVQLSHIREKRRPGSHYASLAYCKREVRIAEQMFQQAGIPYFDSTDTSIEELAGAVMKVKKSRLDQT